MQETSPDIFASFDISFTLLGIGAFFFVFILYGIFSLILVYHWRQYAIGETVIKRTLQTYFISTGILFVVALVAVFFI